MEKIAIRIDEQDFSVPKGTTVLEAALAHNIHIPHLCHHPDLKPVGSCRICLVELDNGRLITSCRTTVIEGMVIKTKTPEIDRVRRPIVEMLIANHHMNCRDCSKKGNCVLQKIRAKTKIDKKRLERLRLPKEELPVDDSNPFFERNPNMCVLCGICVRTCKDIQKVSAINFVGRGYTTRVSPFKDTPIAESRCESCGECVVRCPVGALVAKGFKRPKEEVRSVCPYCGVGCGIYLGIRENSLVNVRGDSESHVNAGQLCVRGRFGLGFVASPERLTAPLIKQNGKFTEASWDEALDLVSSKLKNYTGDKFALLASTKCTNEDSYIAQKFARVVMGSNNVDSSARLCHASSINALYETTGRKAIASAMSETENSKCILVAGTNITRTHPVAGLRIKQAVENGAKLIVISPNEIDLCRMAHIWLRPYPGTDTALIMGMCGVIADEGLLDENFIKEQCDNFEDFKTSLDSYTLGRVERITGIDRDMIVEAAKLYADDKPATILWSTGITQHPYGIDTVLSFVNLTALTGNISGHSALNPIWGQNNALGACDMGCLPDFYPGYQPVTSQEVRKKFESSWGNDLNPEHGLTFNEILQAAYDKKVKALYIIGSDPASSVSHQKVREALNSTEFIVHQDIFLNATAKLADVILPSLSFAEKDGTFTNTERRVQKINKALEPSGNSRPDWQIICEIAKKSGSSGFDFTSPEEIMTEISSLTPLYKHISYSALKEEGMQLIFYQDENIQKGRFKFTPIDYKAPSEKADIDHPLILISERDIYSAGFLSRKVEGFSSLRTKGLVYLNPKDAMDFEIENGKIVSVISRQGEIAGEAKVTHASPAGIVTMRLTEEEIHKLIQPSQEQVAQAPHTKVCAVKIVPQKEPQDE